MNKIKLNDIFYLDDNSLPEWVIDANNCIYCIENCINDSKYIGQTKNLVARFRYGIISHKYNYETYSGNNSLLYSAIKKYKPDNFQVYLLDSNLSIDELNSREIYWISYYHTCKLSPDYISGYNLNSGGHNREHLYTGESLKKSLNTRTLLYGNPAGAAQTEEALEKSRMTNRANHGGVLSINTEIGRKNALSAQRRNHGGVLAFHTEEAKKAAAESHTSDTARAAYNTQVKLYGTAPFHSKESREKMRNSLSKQSSKDARFITEIKTRCNRLAAIDYDSYLNSFSSGQARANHINRLKNRLHRLVSHKNWTEQLSTLFKTLITSDQCDD